MTRFILFFLIMIPAQRVFAQAENSGTVSFGGDSLSSLVTKELIDKYDFLLAYTEESYWWSDHPVYKVLAKKNNAWVAIQLEGKRKKSGQLKVNSISFEFPSDSAYSLMERLKDLHFWSMSKNDLRSETQVQDGVSYRFEIITKDSVLVMETYEPDFNKRENRNPAINNFLTTRELFLQMWNYKYSF